MGEAITFKRPDGNDAPAWYEVPTTGENTPGVVLLQEFWGLNDHIKDVASRIAGLGYRVIAPDLYRKEPTTDAAEARNRMTALDWNDVVYQDIRGAVQTLAEVGKKVGVTGFCMGGGLTIHATIALPEVDAAVAFYGMPPIEMFESLKLHAPLQAHYATQDEHIPNDRVDTLESRLKDAGVTYELHRYEANHAFFNDTRDQVYDKAAADQAWQRLTAWFGRHLADLEGDSPD